MPFDSTARVDSSGHKFIEKVVAKPTIHLERFRRTQRTFLSQFESGSKQRPAILQWPVNRPGPGPHDQNLPALEWDNEPRWRSSSFASRTILPSRLPVDAPLGTAARKSAEARSLQPSPSCS